MLIPDTAYYLRITAPLRASELTRNVVFGAEGFSYTSDNMAFVMTRISKNHYTIHAIHSAKFEKYDFESCSPAVEFALQLVKLDRAGVLREKS